MSEAPRYPKRLIEVDLPIRRISAHARREKSIRHGHISTLHIWWARRPLAACRAVACAALWPDPVDPHCSDVFRVVARRAMRDWAARGMASAGRESFARLNRIAKDEATLVDLMELRKALLDFIADFANWDNALDPWYLETSRLLTRASHDSLGGSPQTVPLVADPFAGGGAIPLEAIRIGAEAFASDLNPVAVLLNQFVLDAVTVTDARKLAHEIRRRAEGVAQKVQTALAPYYPAPRRGFSPVAYLWAHTIRCEGPGCGVEVPLLRSRLIAKGKTPVGYRLEGEPRGDRVRVSLEAPWRRGTPAAGTMKAGAVTCPLCGFTTQKAHVRSQLKARDGGARDARLMCVVETSSKAPGKFYRLPTDAEVAAVKRACGDLASWTRKRLGGLPAIPDEPLPQQRIWKNNPIRVHLYGKITWGDLFSPRQQLALASLAWELRDAAERARRELEGPLGRAVALGLCLVLDKMADSNSVQVWWMASGQKTVGTFTRQALSFIGDFAEIPISEGPSRSITESAEWICRVVENLDAMGLAAGGARAHRADAAALPMPDDAADAVITDPPYYDAVPYGTLSDFFYVWLKRVGAIPMDSAAVVEKKEECVMDEGVGKDGAFFERKMTDCLREARRVAKPEGVGVIVFAHKTTAGWEAMLSSLIEAGWVVTATWPIDTERVVKVNTINRAFLGSSVHIVCRPRETGDGSLRQGHIGDWREVCRELPQRIHSWMPRLAEEGVVGADAIFACLGPALEVFSVYSRVEKADGEPVKLREYLEQVWAAVSKEALSMIFRDPETAGLEPDARLTAMWLWTLAGPTEMDGSDCAGEPDEAEGEGEGEDDPKKREKVLGFPLEYDAARKIAQGLGATLENLTSVVEVKGDKARLLAVGERARSLFGKSEATVPGVVTRAGKKQQMRLFEEEIESVAEEEGWEAAGAPAAGKTALDRVHQAMLLFGTGRSEALKRFLMEGGAGRQAAFWKLAQALSALYPAECDEKRWVDGVLARKKGLGF